MARRKGVVRPKKKSISEWMRSNALKIAVSLSTLGAASTGGIAYSKGDGIDVKVGKVEEKVSGLHNDATDAKNHLHDHDKALNRLDRRTTRMEAQQELMLDALRVPTAKRPVRDYGPEE